jgi:hypothetical protein
VAWVWGKSWFVWWSADYHRRSVGQDGGFVVHFVSFIVVGLKIRLIVQIGMRFIVYFARHVVADFALRFVLIFLRLIPIQVASGR